MSELPKGQSVLVASGTQIPGVQCKTCGYGIPIGNAHTLPESFEVRCEVCRAKATYQLADMRILEAVLKQ
jgi:hypothetical protein